MQRACSCRHACHYEVNVPCMCMLLQAIIVLYRSLPVADVNVQFSPHPPVNVENTWR